MYKLLETPVLTTEELEDLISDEEFATDLENTLKFYKKVADYKKDYVKEKE